MKMPIECYKQNLKGYSSKILEDHSTESDESYGGLSQEVSEGINISS